MRGFSELIKWFLYITPGIVFVYAVNIAIAGEEMIPARTPWDILMSGFLTAVITVFFMHMEVDRKMATIVSGVLHYAALSLAMIGCGCWFGWMKFNAEGIVMMMVSVACVYFIAAVVYYLIDVHQADEINQKLKEKYRDKE